MIRRWRLVGDERCINTHTHTDMDGVIWNDAFVSYVLDRARMVH